MALRRSAAADALGVLASALDVLTLEGLAARRGVAAGEALRRLASLLGALRAGAVAAAAVLGGQTALLSLAEDVVRRRLALVLATADREDAENEQTASHHNLLHLM